MISTVTNSIIVGPDLFQWYHLLHRLQLALGLHCAVFPSTYKSDTVTNSTEIKVEEQVNLSSSHGGREGHEKRYTSSQAPPSRRFEEEIRVTQQTDQDQYRTGPVSQCFVSPSLHASKISIRPPTAFPVPSTSPRHERAARAVQALRH
jgi:hypothetical protein